MYAVQLTAVKKSHARHRYIMQWGNHCGKCEIQMGSPSGVRSRAPAENGFWRILKATERSFLYLYDKIWGDTLH